MSFNNNFYSFFQTATKQNLLKILLDNGWICKHTDNERIEIINEWSELTIYEWDKLVQLNGVLINTPDSFNRLVKIFKDLNINFQAEVYDENGNLISSI